MTCGDIQPSTTQVVAVQVVGDSAVLQLQSRVDWSAHHEFRDAIETAVDAAANDIKVDFGAVEYIDSTVLGLLLILRAEAQAGNKSVYLINCRDNVKAVLDIANFGKLFPISANADVPQAPATPPFFFG